MSSEAGARTAAPPLLATAWGAWPLFFGIGLLMLGNGLQGSLLGVRATREGFGSGVTGLVMACFFAGFLLGSTWTPHAVRRVGHIRVFAAVTAIASITILLHGLLIDAVLWGVMRFVTGLSYAGVFVVAESWLNDRSTNATRGQLLGMYMITIFAGMGGGQLLLNVASPSGSDLFMVASVLISMAVVPMLLSASPTPAARPPHPVPLWRLYRVSPLGTVGTFAAGITNGTVFGMGAVYAQRVGLSVAEISLFMAGLIGGGAILQWPLGKLSDHVDRRLVILVTTFAAAAVAAGVVSGWSDPWLLVLVTLFGGLGLAIHSLCLAYTNDYLAPEEMVAGSSGLVLVLGAGFVLGPPVAGGLMSLAGPAGFFGWLAFVHAAIGVFALSRMSRREHARGEEQAPYVAMPAQTSWFASAAAEEVYGEQDAPEHRSSSGR
jgi:MFS family permease